MNLLHDWRTKALLQGAISMLPGAKACNRLLQRRVTKSLVLSGEKFQSKVRICQRHVDHLRTAGGPRSGFAVFELGTGRFPIIPLGLYLCGAGRIVSMDLTSLLCDDIVCATVARVAECAVQGGFPQALPERVRHLAQVAREPGGEQARSLLRQFGIEIVIGDARHSGLPERSFDLFVSNNTFEHIPRVTLREILAAFRLLARHGAVMSHFIDLCDHYAEYDSAINVFNYLKFSDAAWWWLNSPLQYQNRLRVSDYRALHQAAGWEVCREQNQSGALSELRAIRLAKSFRHYVESDLAVCESWMVAQVPGARVNTAPERAATEYSELQTVE